MYSSVLFLCLFFVYNVTSQDCPLPSNLPAPIRNLILGSTLPVSTCGCIPSVPNCGCSVPNCGCSVPNCGCSNPNCGCLGTIIQAPTVPPCGCYNPAIGLQNPIIGVQSCGCNNPFGCTCGNPVIGNLYGRTTPTIGIATTCGCSDPGVRIVDGCPRCQPIYSYNLPSIGYPTCGCTSVGLPYGLAPNYPVLGGCNCPSVPYGCGCSGPCGCPQLSSCGCSQISSCGCPQVSVYGGPQVSACGCPQVSACGCPQVNSCGCVEVPCGLPKVKTTCTCVTPTVETPCGCIQGKPTCSCATTVEVPTCGLPVLPPFPPVIGCPRYLRQVVVQPPFL